MEFNFKQLVAALSRSPTSTDIRHRITLLLGQQDDKPFDSLLALQQWAWELLSENSRQWIHRAGYQQLFYTLARFNKNLIFAEENIEADTKASLLFPVTVDQINRIFKQIESTNDDNDPYITIVSLWLDNHSHFIYENPQSNVLAITHHINQHILQNYIMSEQFKVYLTLLHQSPLAPKVFTAKMLFYLKTVMFSLFSYIGVRENSFPCTPEEMLHYISDDYLQIIHTHCSTVASWSRELLTCLTYLICFTAGCYWWDRHRRLQATFLFPTDQIVCNHIEDLTNILVYEPIQKQIKAVRSNDETILINAILTIFVTAVHAHDVNWYFRASSTIQNVLSSIAEISPFDEICVCIYGILGTVLTNEQLKNLKIVKTISGFFFNMLEGAWNQPSKRYKQIPIEYLLQGFSNLTKHDIIQQQTVDSNKIPLLIEIGEQYPIVYDILWALSFNQDIQQQLRSSSAFMSKLAHLGTESGNEQMRKITYGLLWNLELKHEDRPTSPFHDENVFDIMISYSHKDKALCKQLYEELVKEGHQVWIDFDQMHGNVMDAMAQAIERSKTVIICMSEEYRKSNYCRAEAHYAFQRQRKIVPVLLQKHYRPDGWLLFLIGQLLYVDFIKYDFDRAMDILLKEIRASDIAETNVEPVPCKEDVDVVHPILPSPSIPPVLPENTLDWTEGDVQNWLIEHKFVQMARLLSGCNGRSLTYLSKYMKHSELRHILSSFREDSLRRLNENLSFVELSRLQTLLDVQCSNL